MTIRIGLLNAVGAAAAAGLILSCGFAASAQDAAKKAPAAATVSACKGLAEAACKAKASTCTWVAPKTGKQKPYCRSKPAKKK